MNLNPMKLNRMQFVLAGLSLALAATGALAQKKYDPGADDKEIKVGHIGP